MTPPIITQDELDAIAEAYRDMREMKGPVPLVLALGLAGVVPILLDEVTRLRAQVEASDRMIDGQLQDAGNLLAVIHRDGGQYIAEHGWTKACLDGEAEVIRLRAAAGDAPR